MSILIRGMEMPKDGCRDCIFVNRKWCGDICPILKREVTGNVERGGFQTDCPLVPVPPHGRLIDGDAFEDFIRKDWDKNDHWIAELVYSRPTVIPAEEEN